MSRSAGPSTPASSCGRETLTDYLPPTPDRLVELGAFLSLAPAAERLFGRPGVPSVAGCIVGLDAGMPSVGRERVGLRLLRRSALTRRTLVACACVIRAFVMSMAAEVQRIVGAREHPACASRPAAPAPRAARSGQRLESLLVIDVKAVVGEPDRLDRWLRRWHIGEEVEQAATLLRADRRVATLSVADGFNSGLASARFMAPLGRSPCASGRSSSDDRLSQASAGSSCQISAGAASRCSCRNSQGRRCHFRPLQR